MNEVDICVVIISIGASAQELEGTALKLRRQGRCQGSVGEDKRVSRGVT